MRMSTEYLVRALKEKGFYGTLDRFNLGQITQDQAEAELLGLNDPNLPPNDRPDEPLIFGRTWNQIKRMQGMKED
jgi:hypothetical protein